MTDERDKTAWRADILARRKALPAEVREREATALAAAAGELVAAAAEPGQAAGTADGTTWVCAYVPVGGEPGSLALLDALRAGGARVLLPVTGEPGPLEWAEYTGPEGLR
ncbi:hypothetical protein ACFXG3_36820, partial [Nocardia tengchongensis]